MNTPTLNHRKKTVAIIQARMGSSRFPEKTLKLLGGRPVLDWVVRAARQTQGIDQVVVATSTENADKALVDYCKKNSIDCFAGDLNDVLKRVYEAALEYKADYVMRLTADCPFLDPQICGTVLLQLKILGGDYVSSAVNGTWPDGLDCEAMTFKALEIANARATLRSHREHVTQYILHHRHDFKVEDYVCPVPKLASERWTLDHVEDLHFLDAIAKHLTSERAPSYLQVLDVLEMNPAYRKLQTPRVRNEGLEKTKREDAAQNVAREFKVSKAYLERAERVIPLGSQTFSKSKTQYPVGYAPLFASHGLGGRIWDIDGNEYVDMVNGLLPNVLGYCDPDVNAAIRSQLNRGITLSLATELETELAEMLTDIIPCAEQVRFGKNGSDATTGCIRLSRAYTGRDRVMVCGYHGWQDWYIGSTTRNKGVPKAVQGLTHQVPYNDLQAIEDLLKKHPEEFACMILEPTNFVEPHKEFLSGLKHLLHSHGALLVFDEVITGFRLAIGGAQDFYGVKPDLASFGKSMGNGMPISAIVGRRDIMKEMEEVFFSGTFGGEALSLAASIAVIKKMKDLKVIPKLWEIGAKLNGEVSQLIAQYNLSYVIELKGNDPWRLIAVKPYKSETVEAIKTLLFTELYKKGVLAISTHNICWAHSDADIAWVAHAYNHALAKLRAELDKGNIEARLEAPVVRPLFRVR